MFVPPYELEFIGKIERMNRTLQDIITCAMKISAMKPRETGIKHHTTIPYYKEENGIVERANKKVNRHILFCLIKVILKIGPDYFV